MYVGEPRPPPHQTPPITRGGRMPPLPTICHLNADDIAECFVAAVDEAEIRMRVKNIEECEKLARRGATQSQQAEDPGNPGIRPGSGSGIAPGGPGNRMPPG